MVNIPIGKEISRVEYFQNDLHASYHHHENYVGDYRIYLESSLNFGARSEAGNAVAQKKLVNAHKVKLLIQSICRK